MKKATKIDHASSMNKVKRTLTYKKIDKNLNKKIKTKKSTVGNKANTNGSKNQST